MGLDKVPQITVAELVSILQSIDQSAKVDVEGCDCAGSAGGVHVEDDGTVMIYRADSDWYTEE